MKVIKRLAPNYWAGYYGVYIAVFACLAFVFREALGKWPETESLFAAAAIYAVSTGSALMAAAIMEGVGYVVLLIPRRIKQIKEEGRAEAREEAREEWLAKGREEGLEEGIAKGRAEGRQEGREEGIAKGRAEGRQESFQQGFHAGRASHNPPTGDEEIESLIAWYNSGGITIDELKTILTQQLNGGEAD